jgi:hypothetical protein
MRLFLRDERLHEGGRIDAQLQLAERRGARSSSTPSNFCTPAPLPPMFGFTTIVKRSPSAAATACDGWWITRAFGYGSPRDSRSESCAAFEIATWRAS